MNDIVVEQRISAPPATVYRFLTQSDMWQQWQGNAAKLDPTPGGIFSMVMGNGMAARGQFLELIPDRRVVFSWGWIDRPGLPPGSSVVEIDLEAAGGDTLLVLTHRLPTEEAPAHRMGWLHYLSRLAVVAAGEDPGPDTGPG